MTFYYDRPIMNSKIVWQKNLILNSKFCNVCRTYFQTPFVQSNWVLRSLFLRACLPNIANFLNLFSSAFLEFVRFSSARSCFFIEKIYKIIISIFNKNLIFATTISVTKSLATSYIFIEIILQYTCDHLLN